MITGRLGAVLRHDKSNPNTHAIPATDCAPEPVDAPRNLFAHRFCREEGRLVAPSRSRRFSVGRISEWLTSQHPAAAWLRQSGRKPGAHNAATTTHRRARNTKRSDPGKSRTAADNRSRLRNVHRAGQYVPAANGPSSTRRKRTGRAD